MTHWKEQPEHPATKLVREANEAGFTDVHLYTATIMYNKPADQITTAERLHAKRKNFGILYNQGPNTLKA